MRYTFTLRSTESQSQLWTNLSTAVATEIKELVIVREKTRLITKTAVEFHSHRDVVIPCCGCQSDVSRFHWRNQRIFCHAILITVSCKHLKRSNISENALHARKSGDHIDSIFGAGKRWSGLSRNMT